MGAGRADMNRDLGCSRRPPRECCSNDPRPPSDAQTYLEMEARNDIVVFVAGAQKSDRRPENPARRLEVSSGPGAGPGVPGARARGEGRGPQGRNRCPKKHPLAPRGRPRSERWAPAYRMPNHRSPPPGHSAAPGRVGSAVYFSCAPPTLRDSATGMPRGPGGPGGRQTKPKDKPSAPSVRPCTVPLARGFATGMSGSDERAPRGCRTGAYLFPWSFFGSGRLSSVFLGSGLRGSTLTGLTSLTGLGSTFSGSATTTTGSGGGGGGGVTWTS